MFMTGLKIMFILPLLNLLSFVTSIKGQTLQVVPPKKIAIIGGGIGGSSAAYFIREKFGADVHVDLFEENSLACGRLATVSIAGREYESGGSIIHPRNKYMKTFVEKLPGLEEAKLLSGRTLGFFDDENYILQTSRWWIITFLEMIWNFGFDLMRLSSLEERFLEKFERIYDLQDRGQSYENVSSLLYGMAGNSFVHTTQIPAKELFSSYGISEFTIDNFVTPGLRNNYGQNASANGFVGAVSMAGIQSGLWSVKGGNKLVCEKLIQESSANLVHERVTAVKLDKTQDGKFLVSSHRGSSRSYDIVIIAAPIRRDIPGFIDVSQACSDVDSCPGQNPDERRYRRTVANFVHGKLNSNLFKCNSIAECPGFIIVPNQDTFYRSIGLHVPVDYDPNVDQVEGIYKVFTTEPMTTEQKNYLFESYSETATVDWLAYPYYQPPEKLDSFVINPNGVYYTSPIEWAASAIEMSVISAKNAVLLSYNNWYKISQNMAHGDALRSTKEDL